MFIFEKRTSIWCLGPTRTWSPKWKQQLWDIPSVSLPFGSLLSSLSPNLTPTPSEPSLLSSDTQYRCVVHCGLSLFFQESSGSYRPVQEIACLCWAQVEMSSVMTKSFKEMHEKELGMLAELPRLGDILPQLPSMDLPSDYRQFIPQTFMLFAAQI